MTHHEPLFSPHCRYAGDEILIWVSKNTFQGHEKEISFPGRVEIFLRFIIRHANDVSEKCFWGKFLISVATELRLQLQCSLGRHWFPQKFYREKCHIGSRKSNQIKLKNLCRSSFFSSEAAQKFVARDVDFSAKKYFFWKHRASSCVAGRKRRILFTRNFHKFEEYFWYGDNHMARQVEVT